MTKITLKNVNVQKTVIKVGTAAIYGKAKSMFEKHSIKQPNGDYLVEEETLVLIAKEIKASQNGKQASRTAGGREGLVLAEKWLTPVDEKAPDTVQEGVKSTGRRSEPPSYAN